MVGMDLRQAIMPLPFKEPSQTLYSLLGTLIDSGRRFASMADMKVGDMQGKFTCRHNNGYNGTWHKSHVCYT